MMKKTFIFLFLLGLVFSGSYLLGSGKFNLQKGPTSQIEKEHFFSSRFTSIPLPIQNHFFTIVILGKNNGVSVEKTLDSVFSQNYENFRILYIDDASEDESFDLASDLIYESKQSLRVTSTKNETPLGDLANLVRAVESCGDEEIVVVLGSGEWLAHEWVLQRMNSYYADPDLWMAYGNACTYPEFEIGECPIANWEEGDCRKSMKIAPSLKSFYAGLFKKIHKEDFIARGQYLTASSDFAYTVPLLEMAAEHFHWIPEVLYIRSSDNFPENPEAEAHCEQFIRRLPSYPKICGSLFSPKAIEDGAL